MKNILQIYSSLYLLIYYKIYLHKPKKRERIFEKGMKKIAKMQNLSQSELNQIAEMRDQSRDELERIAKIRRIKRLSRNVKRRVNNISF